MMETKNIIKFEFGNSANSIIYFYLQPKYAKEPLFPTY